MKYLIKKVAFFIAYSIFAGYSSWMTATSLHLKWFSAMPFALAFIIIFIISLVAGWLFSLAFDEVKSSHPNKTKFVSSLLGFLLFWGFSFATNVHYSYVNQYGYENINSQVNSCIVYLTDKTKVADAEFKNMKDSKKLEVDAEVKRLQTLFHRSLRDARTSHVGFGDDCIGILKSIEQFLKSDSAIYHDPSDYTIFDDKHDIGDRGTRDYNKFSYLQDKYDKRINSCINQKLKVIDYYYESQKINNDNLKNALELAKKIEQESLPQIKNKKEFSVYQSCYNKDISDLLGKMPKDYFNSTVESKKLKNGTEEIEEYYVYPSSRMFDFQNVWADWFTKKLPRDHSLIGTIIIALIIDIIAFILFMLFCLKD